MSDERRRLTTVFTKRPEAGRVKTRLCPPLSPAEAAELATAMLDDTVVRLSAAPGFATELAVAPAGSVGWFRERYADRVPVSPQVGDGLGERLARWFEARCAPDRTVVVVGSDCPSLGAEVVAEAHERLAAGADVVFAPDGGGGYGLVGMSRPAPELFTEVPMSTRTMFEETLALARAQGLSPHVLAEHRDVDEPGDLERLDAEMRSSTMEGRSADPAFPARTFEWLRRRAERT